MAVVKNDPFPGTDYSKYQSWEKVTTPGGQVWYVVPGNPGYVFDPVASNASGRKVFRANPSAQISEQQAQKDAQQRQIDQQEQARSPAGQLLPVAGTVAGTVGSAYAINQLVKPNAIFQGLDPKTGNQIWSDGVRSPNGQPLTPPAAQPAAAPAPTTQSQAAAQGASTTGTPAPNTSTAAPVTPVGSATMPDGSPGTLMSDGAVVAENGAIAQPDGTVIPATSSPIMGTIQAVGGAAQAYSGYKQWQNGQKLGGAANVLGGAYNTYAGYVAATGGTNALGSYGGYVAPAVAAAQVGQNMIDQEGATADRAAASKTEALKAAMMYIPVYGQAAYAALAGADALSGGKATATWTKANKKLDDFNSKIDFGLQRWVDSKLFHQSTRGAAKQNTAELYNASEDPKYREYVAGMREQYNEAPKDKTKQFAGKYGSWDEYQKAGLEAGDLTGVYGNIKTYGPAWANLTQEQRQAVTQANIESNLYSSKKGDVLIKDEEKAKQNFDNVMKGFQAGVQTGVQATVDPKLAPLQPGQTAASTASFATGQPQTPAQAAAQGSIAKIVMPRTNTRSPGVGLDGRRISYR